MIGKCGRRAVGLGFAIAMAAGLAAPALAAGGFTGRTIQAVYSLTPTGCRPSIGKCETGASISGSANIYVSTKGRVFDYATNQSGHEVRIGQTYTMPTGRPARWLLRGSRLVHQIEEPLLSHNVVYTLAGPGRCTIHVEAKSKHRELIFTTQASVQSCTVVDGLRER